MKAAYKSGWSGSDLRKDLLADVPSGASQVTSLSALSGAIARTIQARLDDAVSVKDFGAVGDGVTDDTDAIQLAIDSGAGCLFFPDGVYLVTTLNPVSYQAWVGAGRAATVLTWAQANIPTLNYNMVQTTGDINHFHVLNMTLRGSRPFQTTQSFTGQDMGCFHMRAGSVTNFSLRNCVVAEFGDQVNVGGFGVLLGATSGTGHVIDGIVVADCLFENISNVPGVYINGDGSFHTTLSRITIERNQFTADITTSDQNCIYILGSSTNVGTDVLVDSNRFTINYPIDCAIELNWISGFQVIHNTITAFGAGTCTPVLIRDGCNLGTVSGNQIQDKGTGTVGGSAISLVRFTTGTDTQTNISVLGNIIQGWGTGSQGRAINIGAGSSQIICSDNMIIGPSAASRIEAGIAIGTETRNILVSDNLFRYLMYVVTFAGTTTNVLVESNVIDRCGDGAVSMVIDNAPDMDLTYVVFKDNTVSNPIAGTASFISLTPAAITGNRIETNTLPPTLNAMNPSYLNKVDSIVSPATGSGKAVVAMSYTFSQGSLPMSDGEGFTIGANLDGQVPQCAFGDQVIASFLGNSQGVTITAYVSAANQVRIRVQNETGALVTIPAGDWSVLIFKQ